ncbi:MAG: hypothetical protein F4X40_05465 [Chloroflexi bacterium]|nr:hypothetical protein [Chloroflexota bacterium]
MTDQRMPTTLPSPADRGEFRFVAVDAEGTLWRWIDHELVWLRVAVEPKISDQEAGGCEVRH